MEYINNLATATLDEAFGLRPAKEIVQISLGQSKINNNYSNPGDLQPYQEVTNHQIKPFIEANTQEVKLQHLQNECIIPVFSKDNEKTISHQEFIEIAQNCISNIYPTYSFTEPEIRVSH